MRFAEVTSTTIEEMAHRLGGYAPLIVYGRKAAKRRLCG
jgi:hypothetical protein